VVLSATSTEDINEGLVVPIISQRLEGDGFRQVVEKSEMVRARGFRSIVKRFWGPLVEARAPRFPGYVGEVRDLGELEKMGYVFYWFEHETGDPVSLVDDNKGAVKGIRDWSFPKMVRRLGKFDLLAFGPLLGWNLVLYEHYLELCGLYHGHVASIYRVLRAGLKGGVLKGEVQVRDCVKRFADGLKINGRQGWQLLQGMDTFLGFSVHEPKIDQAVDDWLTGGDVLRPEMKNIFSEGVRSFFLSLTFSPDPNFPSLEQWIRQPERYATGGAMFSAAVQTPRPRWARRRTKKMIPLYFTPETIESWFERAVPSHTRVFAKVELGKPDGRPVLNSNVELFVVQMYVLDWLVSGTSRAKYTSLLMKRPEFFSFWLDVGKKLGSSYWAIPVDQEKFDRHVAGWEVEEFHTVLSSFCRARGFHSGARAVDISLGSITTGTVFYGDKRWPWTKGLLSGWAWTALMGTAINYASFYIVERVLLDKSLNIRVHLRCFQGDDAILVVGSRDETGLITDTYNKIGLAVNPAKTYVSRKRNDFLRLGYETGIGWFGLPARAINSLNWRNPASDGDPGGVARVRGIVSQHSQVLSRLVALGGQERWDLCLDELVQLGPDRTRWVKWLHTPVVIGGGGVAPYGSEWVAIIGDQQEAEKPRRHRAEGWPSWVSITEDAEESRGFNLSEIETRGVVKSGVKPFSTFLYPPRLAPGISTYRKAEVVEKEDLELLYEIVRPEELDLVRDMYTRVLTRGLFWRWVGEGLGPPTPIRIGLGIQVWPYAWSRWLAKQPICAYRRKVTRKTLEDTWLNAELTFNEPYGEVYPVGLG
jgi:hypothetical protein